MHDIMADVDQRGEEIEGSKSEYKVETSVNGNLQPLEGANSVVCINYSGLDIC